MKKYLSVALAIILTITCVSINLHNLNAASTDKNQDGFYMENGDETARLLERNKVSKTKLGDFEWQFDVLAESTENVNVSFVFHAGENADTFSYASRNNLFAVTLFGSKVDETKNCAVSNALVVEYGGNSNNKNLGYMRPFDYDSKVTPWKIKDNSYLKLDSASAKKAIVTNKEFTVNIKMVGRLITVSTWQTSDKTNTYRELNVNMHKSIAEKFTSGDFAILNSSNSCGLWIKNMSVKTKAEIFNSNNYAAPNHINPSIAEGSADGNLWLGNGRISTIAANKDRLYMDSWKTSNEILERNKISKTDVSDFEWSFDYLPNGANTRSAFVFHVNDKSKVTGTNAYWDRNYAFSLMVWGSDWSYAGTANKAATDYAMPHSICMQIPVYSSTDANMMGKPRPLGNYAKDETSGKFKHTTANTYLELGSIDLSKWVTVTIKMEGAKITLTVKQGSIELSKQFTVSANQLSLALSGDFAVIQGGNQSGYRNMVIKVPDLDIKITEFDELAPTGTLYTNNFEKESLDGIQFTYHNEEKTAIMAEESGNKFLRAYPDMRTKEDGTLQVVGNGNLLFSFGPQNAMDFQLTFKLRVKSNTHENLGSTIVGIHSLPSNLKWDTVWFNLLARGTSVSLKDTTKSLGIDNLIAKTGKNRSGGTAYMPSDNRDFGVRPDGKWHDVKVVTKGYKYSLYVDGKLYLTATDKNKTFDKGYTVIGSNGCIIDVDDISLTNK